MLALAPVPAPLWLIDVLHGLTFVLHTAAMNAMVGCAFALAICGPGREPVAATAARLLPPLISITVTLGVAPLLFLQLVHGERFYASSIHMAWPWLLALGGLIVGYYAAYACEGAARASRRPAAWVRVLPLASMLTFSFVLASNVALSEHPATLAALTAEPGWSLALAATHAPLRWVHEIVGAIALGSLVFVLLGASQEGEPGAALRRWGTRVLLLGTAVAVVLGIVQLLARPSAVAGATPGASLTVGIVSGLTTPLLVWRYARRPAAGLLVAAVATGFVTLTAKTVLRFAMRAKRLAAEGPVVAPETAPTLGPFLFFALCFVLALLALGWLLRVLGRMTPEGGALTVDRERS